VVHPATGTRTPAIQLRGWSKDFGGGRGVLELDLDVRRGEVLGFVGPNGAGKSTTIRSLLGFLKPTAGRARVLGLDPDRNGEEVRARTGYLPGELSLWENRTGRRFLDDMAALRGGVDEPFRDELVRRLGVDLDTRVRRLSKGNKQKLGLVQAFMHKPELLVLDEPTDGLDPLLRREVHRLVREARDGGATVFLSSHVIHEVEQVCDRVALIRRARLLLCERVRDLHGRLREEVFVRFAEPVPPSALEGLAGVERFGTRSPTEYRFVLDGPPDALLKAVSRFRVDAFWTKRQDLEEALLYLYAGDGP